MEHFLRGVHFVVPKVALQSLSWENAEIRAMGIPTVDIDLLRINTSSEHVSFIIELLTDFLIFRATVTTG